MGKAVKFATREIERDDSGRPVAVVCKFTDGDTLKCSLTDMSKEMAIEYCAYGLSARIGTAWQSINADSLGEAKDKAREFWDRTLSGEWRALTRGINTASAPLTVRAVARLQGIDVAQALSAWAKLDRQTRENTRFDARVQAMAAAIKAEDAQKAVQKATGDANAPKVDLGSTFGERAA